MENPIRRAVLQACRNFMVPIARFLLRNGIGYKEFAEVAKWAFVHVASEDYGIRGRITNVSRVSVITGLSRKDVKRVRDGVPPEPPTEIGAFNPAGYVLSAWHQKPEFVDDLGLPRVLAFKGAEASFEHLVQDAVGDVPAGALLSELRRANVVEVTPAGEIRVLRRHFVPLPGDTEMLTRFGLRVGDLASTIDYNASRTNDALGRFEATAYTSKLDPRFSALFRRIVSERGLKFLENMDDWLSAHQLPAEERESSPTTLAGVGVYLFEGMPNGESKDEKC